MTMRDAARLLLIEAAALPLVLDDAPEEALDGPTICTGWSVRDVLAHCGAALTMTASGDRHGFTPEENETDVEQRRTWPLGDVLDELFDGYQAAAAAIDRAGGALDGIGLGEWVHGGDVRGALGAPDAYSSAGSDLAVILLLARSAQLAKPSLETSIDGETGHFGVDEPPQGTLVTDTATFVRLTGGRAPDPDRFTLNPEMSSFDLVLFS